MIVSGIKPLTIPSKKCTQGKLQLVLRIRKVTVGREGKFPAPNRPAELNRVSPADVTEEESKGTKSSGSYLGTNNLIQIW